MKLSIRGAVDGLTAVQMQIDGEAPKVGLYAADGHLVRAVESMPAPVGAAPELSDEQRRGLYLADYFDDED